MTEDTHHVLESICNGNVEEIEEWFEQQQHDLHVDAVVEGETPLLHACRYCIGEVDAHVAMIRFLLQRGANVHATSANGQTVLHNAMSDFNAGRYDEIVRLLLQWRGGGGGGGGGGVNVNATDCNGMTPLHLAPDAATARLLLERGSFVHAANNFGWTALHYACRNGNVGLVHVLLEYGADWSLKTNAGDTPIEVAHGAMERCTSDDFIQYRIQIALERQSERHQIELTALHEEIERLHITVETLQNRDEGSRNLLREFHQRSGQLLE